MLCRTASTNQYEGSLVEWTIRGLDLSGDHSFFKKMRIWRSCAGIFLSLQARSFYFEIIGDRWLMLDACLTIADWWLMLNACLMGHGSWLKAHGPRRMAHGAWLMVKWAGLVQGPGEVGLDLGARTQAPGPGPSLGREPWGMSHEPGARSHEPSSIKHASSVKLSSYEAIKVSGHQAIKLSGYQIFKLSNHQAIKLSG